jgi:uncharacterized damage-inducible protein DinB
MQTFAVRLAEYNRWMNGQMIAAARKLSPQDLASERGAFFGSILGTLNHLLVADTIWLRRFALGDAPFAALEPMKSAAVPSSLRDTLAPDLASYESQRTRLDTIISAWSLEIREPHLSLALSYTNMSGQHHTKRFGDSLLHLFNHQTHHRGQASTLLYQAGVDVGDTDLLAVLPTVEI